MAHDLYVGVLKDPEFVYSGEPEAWRENIELVVDLGAGPGGLADFAKEPGTRQVDWATFILPLTHEELVARVGPRREADVSSYRRYMPGKSDPEIRETMNLDPRAKVDALPPDRPYVLVSVEGL